MAKIYLKTILATAALTLLVAGIACGSVPPRAGGYLALLLCWFIVCNEKWSVGERWTWRTYTIFTVGALILTLVYAYLITHI